MTVDNEGLEVEGIYDSGIGGINSWRLQWIFTGRLFIYYLHPMIALTYAALGFRKTCFFSYYIFLFGMFLAGSHCSVFNVFINTVLHLNWTIGGFHNPFYMMMWTFHFDHFILKDFLTNHIEVFIKL